MSRQTFTWFPDVGSEHDVKPNVNVTKYGDGYEARSVDGINSQPMKWSVTFTRGKVEVQNILSFIRARGALEAFNWTNPQQEAGVYVCREWKAKRIQGDFTQLSCTFEQVFEA